MTYSVFNQTIEDNDCSWMPQSNIDTLRPEFEEGDTIRFFDDDGPAPDCVSRVLREDGLALDFVEWDEGDDCNEYRVIPAQ